MGLLHGSDGDARFSHVIHYTIDLTPGSSNVNCRVVNDGARAVDMGVLGEGALGVPMLLGPVKVLTTGWVLIVLNTRDGCIWYTCCTAKKQLV